jgi:sugar lactone lactonase YvrE
MMQAAVRDSIGGAWQVVERGGARDQLGEGLLWSPREGALYWTDIVGQKLHRLTLEGGALTSWDMPQMIGWVIGRASQDGFIAGLKSGFHELRLSGREVQLTHIADPHGGGEHDLRMNDAKADAQGRIWAGSMSVNADRPAGSLFRLDPDRTVRTMDDHPYIVANGPAIAPDGRTFYHTDTGLGVVFRFTLGKDGSLTQRREFIRFADLCGRPDGMTVDAEGCLWVAHWGGGRVTRFTPEGERERAYALPASQITNVSFAGPDCDRLFVTSAAEGRGDEPLAGALFEINTGGICGLPPQLYGG